LFGNEERVAKEETELFRSVAAKGLHSINADDSDLVKAGKKFTAR